MLEAAHAGVNRGKSGRWARKPPSPAATSASTRQGAFGSDTGLRQECTGDRTEEAKPEANRDQNRGTSVRRTQTAPVVLRIDPQHPHRIWARRSTCVREDDDDAPALPDDLDRQAHLPSRQPDRVALGVRPPADHDNAVSGERLVEFTSKTPTSRRGWRVKADTKWWLQLEVSPSWSAAVERSELRTHYTEGPCRPKPVVCMAFRGDMTRHQPRGRLKAPCRRPRPFSRRTGSTGHDEPG